LTDEEFWKKYNLREIWFDVKEYKEDNKAKNMLGTIIVFLACREGVYFAVGL